MSKDISIKEVAKNASKEMNMVRRWIARRTAKKMRNKLIHVYDTLIDQFYKYETKKYVRHDTIGVGTKDGVNLYKALQSHAGEPPRLQESFHSVDGGIYIDAVDMDDTNYRIDKDIVLNYIINKGIRFPNPKFDEWKFTASYVDEECSAEGTIVEVLESVRDQLADKYAKEAKQEAIKELDLKYITIE